jgi:hypothetical protein
MAYISAFDDEEEEKPAATAGAAPPVAGAAPGPVAQAAPAASRFVNFSRYLNANQGATNRTVQGITGSINQQGQAVQNDLAGAQSAFGTAVKTGSNPATGYTGPSSLADNAEQWTGLQDRARKVQDTAAATASPGGLGAVLQDQNRGAYGDGNRRLDTALTGYAGADQFAQARERYGKLSSALTQANDASTKTADTARATTADAKTTYDAEQKAAADRTAAAKQAADDDKLLIDVGSIMDKRTADLRDPLHKRERVEYLTKTGQLKAEIESRFGAGAWDRYVAAKEKREQARAGGIRATIPGGL